MASGAPLHGRFVYPHEEFREALRDLMFCQFHDVLPGSSVPAAEEAALVRLGHGIDTIARVRARALFALTSGEPDPADGEIPIFVYNPHPFPVSGVFEVEFQPASHNREGTFMSCRVRQSAAQAVDDVPAQFEKEASTVGVDWRKRMVLRAILPPAALTRFDSTPVALDAVRVIEDGPVRTVVEAVFVYGASQLVLTYALPLVGA